MILVCCPRCRLRFTRAAAAYMTVCPECGEPPEPIASLEHTFGFRLVGPEDLPQSLPQAVAAPLPVFEPDGAQS